MIVLSDPLARVSAFSGATTAVVALSLLFPLVSEGSVGCRLKQKPATRCCSSGPSFYDVKQGTFCLFSPLQLLTESCAVCLKCTSHLNVQKGISAEYLRWELQKAPGATACTVGKTSFLLKTSISVCKFNIDNESHKVHACTCKLGRPSN